MMLLACHKRWRSFYLARMGNGSEILVKGHAMDPEPHTARFPALISQTIYAPVEWGQGRVEAEKRDAQTLNVFRHSPLQNLRIHSACGGILKKQARRWDMLTSVYIDGMDGLDAVLPKLSSAVSLEIRCCIRKELTLSPGGEGCAVLQNLRILTITGNQRVQEWCLYTLTAPSLETLVINPTTWPPPPSPDPVVTVSSSPLTQAASCLIRRSRCTLTSFTWRGFPDVTSEAQAQDLLSSLPGARKLQLFGISPPSLPHLERQLILRTSPDDAHPLFMRLLESLSFQLAGEPNTVSFRPLIKIAAYRSGLVAAMVDSPSKEGFVLRRMLFDSVVEQTLQGDEMEKLAFLAMKWGMKIRLGQVLVKKTPTEQLGSNRGL
ncbi:hypothetical protein BDV98DRAFT_287282 [Pterulicium gracile]|uniref:Uncharacterized protein n=1 Tax=Pterulicium gracile TaxID=1884261 RepID=A0A5C3QTD7_9AGAR|nr:hypothetical protein BDV98DRAFT_287282 [Pterula gracilis]